MIDKVVHLRYRYRYMISNVYGIKEFQMNLAKIARSIREAGGHYLVTNRNKPAMVAIPFEDYKEIEDILLELNSPGLKREIKLARQEYEKGKSADFRKFISEKN